MLGGDDALQALRLSPDNLPLRQHLADTLLGSGRADEAEQEYRAALALAPEDRRLKLGLASAFHQQGKHAPARVIVEELARGSEASARVCLLYARLLLQGGEAGRAVLQYRRAIELDPAVADPDLAERLGIRPGSASTPEEQGDPYVVEGRVRAAWEDAAEVAEDSIERPTISRGRLGEAAAAIEEALRLDPKDADYYGRLAAIRLDQRRWGDALDAAEEGLRVEPEHDACTNLRAMALVQLGRRDEAGATIEGALARDPENAASHANLGWSLLHGGDHTRALEHFRVALRLDPTLEWAQAGLVEALKARYPLYRYFVDFGQPAS